jgi:hypothetical protein
MADARMLAGIGTDGQLVQQLASILAKEFSLAVDELHLPFDAERRTARRIPLDSQG